MFCNNEQNRFDAVLKEDSRHVKLGHATGLRGNRVLVGEDSLAIFLGKIIGDVRDSMPVRGFDRCEVQCRRLRDGSRVEGACLGCHAALGEDAGNEGKMVPKAVEMSCRRE